MKDLIGQMRHQTQMMSQDVSSMVKSNDFEESMNAAHESDNVRAELTIKALKLISLDIKSGEKAASFFIEGDGQITFLIGFFRWVNFIGMFSLLANGDLSKQVIAAINENLNSKMFKAAKMYRRLNERRRSIYAKTNKLAMAAYSAKLQEFQGRRLSESESQIVDDAYDRIMDPRMLRVDEKIQSVGNAASPGFVRGYSESVAIFLCQHLPLIQCAANLVLEGEVKSADCKAVQLAFCVETIL